jgi:hypothetical protein
LEHAAAEAIERAPKRHDERLAQHGQAWRRGLHDSLLFYRQALAKPGRRVKITVPADINKN